MQFFRRNRKRLISAFLILMLLVLLPMEAATNNSAYAKSAKTKRKEAEDNLNETNDLIDDLEDQQADVDTDINNKTSQLDGVIANINTTNDQIDAKEAEIEQAAEDLAAAQETADEEYASMKLRIQYMYENNTESSFWEALLGSTGLADMLVRMEYVSDIYNADRQLMDDYEQAIEDVETRQAELNAEMDELSALMESLESQQSNLQYSISCLEDSYDNYSSQISAAQDLAADYQAQYEHWDQIVQQQEAAAAHVTSGTYEGGGTGSSGLGSAAYLTDDSYDPAYQTDISGTDLVNYALQYVGNPYVWGGNSLTEGCDCSGFVHLIYAHFGISTPRYSQSFKSVGQPVSYNNMKAGDVVVYPGHVAIYIGNGCIVEAQSTRAGITSSRSVNCHTITAIVRLL